MNAPTPNTLAWFEVAANDPEKAQRFYGELFDWTFTPDPDSASMGMDYRLISVPGSDAPMGGVVATSADQPEHAIFTIVVADVAAVCDAAEGSGGTVVSKEVTPKAGPAFAYLRDPAGNLFGVFSPPA